MEEDGSGFTEQQRHEAILSGLKKVNKDMTVFHLRWCPGDLLSAKMLQSTPMFWYMKFGWGRRDIENLFAEARVYIDETLDNALDMVFGTDSDNCGPRWLPPSEQENKRAKWKRRGDKKTQLYYQGELRKTASRLNVPNRPLPQLPSKTGNQLDSETMNRKSLLNQELQPSFKKIWSAISDSESKDIIDSDTFCESLKKYGIEMNSQIAKKLYDQIVPNGKLDKKKMEDLLQKLDNVSIPAGGTINAFTLQDLDKGLNSLMLMKRIFYSLAFDKPFNVDEFVSSKMSDVQITVAEIILQKLCTRDADWNVRLNIMENISNRLGNDPSYDDLLKPENESDLVMGWMVQCLDSNPNVANTAIGLLPNIFYELMTKGDSQLATAHLDDIFNSLFDILDNNRCKDMHNEAEDTLSELVDTVVKEQDPEAVLYMAGLLSEKTDTENCTNPKARETAMKNLKKIVGLDGEDKPHGDEKISNTIQDKSNLKEQPKSSGPQKQLLEDNPISSENSNKNVPLGGISEPNKTEEHEKNLNIPKEKNKKEKSENDDQSTMLKNPDNKNTFSNIINPENETENEIGNNEKPNNGEKSNRVSEDKNYPNDRNSPKDNIQNKNKNSDNIDGIKDTPNNDLMNKKDPFGDSQSNPKNNTNNELDQNGNTTIPSSFNPKNNIKDDQNSYNSPNDNKKKDMNNHNPNNNGDNINKTNVEDDNDPNKFNNDDNNENDPQNISNDGPQNREWLEIGTGDRHGPSEKLMNQGKSGNPSQNNPHIPKCRKAPKLDKNNKIQNLPNANNESIHDNNPDNLNKPNDKTIKKDNLQDNDDEKYDKPKGENSQSRKNPWNNFPNEETGPKEPISKNDNKNNEISDPNNNFQANPKHLGHSDPTNASSEKKLIDNRDPRSNKIKDNNSNNNNNQDPDINAVNENDNNKRDPTENRNPNNENRQNDKEKQLQQKKKIPPNKMLPTFDKVIPDGTVEDKNPNSNEIDPDNIQNKHGENDSDKISPNSNIIDNDENISSDKIPSVDTSKNPNKNRITDENNLNNNPRNIKDEVPMSENINPDNEMNNEQNKKLPSDKILPHIDPHKKDNKPLPPDFGKNAGNPDKKLSISSNVNPYNSNSVAGKKLPPNITNSGENNIINPENQPSNMDKILGKNASNGENKKSPLDEISPDNISSTKTPSLENIEPSHNSNDPKNNDNSSPIRSQQIPGAEKPINEKKELTYPLPNQGKEKIGSNDQKDKNGKTLNPNLNTGIDDTKLQKNNDENEGKKNQKELENNNKPSGHNKIESGGNRYPIDDSDNNNNNNNNNQSIDDKPELNNRKRKLDNDDNNTNIDTTTSNNDNNKNKPFINEENKISDHENDQDLTPKEIGDEFRDIFKDGISNALLDPNKQNSNNASEFVDLIEKMKPGFAKVLDPEAQKRYEEWKFRGLKKGKRINEAPYRPLPNLKIGEKRLHRITHDIQFEIKPPTLPDI